MFPLPFWHGLFFNSSPPAPRVTLFLDTFSVPDDILEGHFPDVFPDTPWVDSEFTSLIEDETAVIAESVEGLNAPYVYVTNPASFILTCNMSAEFPATTRLYVRYDPLDPGYTYIDINPVVNISLVSSDDGITDQINESENLLINP